MQQPNIADITAPLADLNRMTTAELAVKFEELHGFPIRSRNKVHLRKRIAWRIQELAEGGLSKRALDRIEELAPEIPEQWRSAEKPKPEKTKRDTRLPKPGGVITKQHNGTTHTVTVLEKGFEYEGETYRSLSAIAKEITGTPWNGFLFFGLTERTRRNKCR